MQLRDLFNELPITPGAVVPFELQQLLRAELDVKDNWHDAELLLLQAMRVLPDQLELGVALYKLYAYSNRFDDAMKVINGVLAAAATAEGIPADWRLLTPALIAGRPFQGALRCYLYSLKATGFVCLRKGDTDLAWEVLCRLQALDPQDQVGGSVVLAMAERLRQPDD